MLFYIISYFVLGFTKHSFVPCVCYSMPGDSPGMGGLGSQGQMRHAMMSFKQFLTQQDDSIGETEAIAAYNEYKAEFKRKQMEEFFEEHKEEDW